MKPETYLGISSQDRGMYLLSCRNEPIKYIKANKIILFLCNYFNQEVKDVVSSSRKLEYTKVRHYCMYFIDKYCNLSLKRIGALFGDRDHSTVLYAKNSIKGYIGVNKKIREEVQELDYWISKKALS